MTVIGAGLVETLLHQAESDHLDFKRDQYKFVGASDEEKAKLLKDILAFANSWKTTDAYIVIGADDGHGGRASVVGVDHQLDDATLQQFVNSKTNRLVEFAYMPASHDGVQIAVIRIARRQRRPILLKSRYASLQPNTAYVRRGSSTAVADASEVEQMVLDEIAPSVGISFGDGKTRVSTGEQRLVLRPRPLLKAPPEMVAEMEKATANIDKSLWVGAGDVFKTTGVLSEMVAMSAFRPFQPNAAELREHERLMSALTPVWLTALNSGGSVATDVILKAKLPKTTGLLLFDAEPKKPTGGFDLHLQDARTVHLFDRGADQELKVRFGKIRPGDRTWSDPIWIGAREPTTVEFDASVFADNIPRPIDLTLVIEIRPRPRWEY